MYRHKFLLYGGAGGGGKSRLLRWGAVHFLIECAHVGIRNAEFGLFSEDYPTLKDRQVTKMQTEIPAWLGVVKSTETHGLGLYLHERYGSGIVKLRNLDQPEKYKSAEFAGIGVEELTMNAKSVFDDLRWRRRWPGLDHTPFIAATNPTGIGHGWVKKLWIDRDFSGDDSRLNPDDFAFIQALPTDNPYLSDEYWKELDSLPDSMREALLFGSWDVYQGQALNFRRERHVVEPFKIPADWPRWTATDDGYTDPTCTLWFARGPRGARLPNGTTLVRPRIFVYREFYERQMLAQEKAAIWVQWSRGERILRRWGDPAMKQHRGSSHLSMFDEYEAGGWPMEEANNDRSVGIERVRRALDWGEHDDAVQAGAIDWPSELAIFSNCLNLIRTLPSLPVDHIDPEDIDTNAEDHAYDALRYGLMAADGLTRQGAAGRQYSVTSSKRPNPGSAATLWKREPLFRR